jgi:hypothetical protein
MGEVFLPLTFASKSGYRNTDDPAMEYPQWWLRIKQLLCESNYAKEKGQWKKAQDLLFEAGQIARDHHLKAE